MKRSLLALTLLAALPFAAAAQDSSGLNYNYVEGGYVATNLDNDNGDIDADGFGGNASVALSDNFHLFGGFNTQDTDTFDLFETQDETNTDINQWRIGLGYNLPIAASTDLVARAAYEKFEIDDVTINGQTYEVGEGDDGYSAEVGVRTAFTDNFEGHAFAGYEDFGNDADDFYGRVGALVKFNPSWGISGDVKFADGDTQWFVGPRFSW
ncbi:MAG TPA: diffusible signal factor-reguated Ax21 family protein [Xanthomonadaceae bacterium]|jgi:Ax21 family sulfation-dependent quorum factor|nr:diffusible signal factor-reguated Ax21 family protein [Xanthomonadaceae bacterium]